MRIFDNLLYKIVALLIAAVLWAAAQGVRQEAESFDLDVAITDVPEQLIVVEQSAREINLTLQGSRAALRQAREDLTRYVVSLAGVEEGETRLPVTPEGLPALPRRAEVVARSPSTLVFKTESLLIKDVGVRPDVGGDLPEGYHLRELRVEPAQVRLAGPRSSVGRIREVATERIDLTGLTETTLLKRRLMLLSPNVRRADAEEGTVDVILSIEAPPSLEEPNVPAG